MTLRDPWHTWLVCMCTVLYLDIQPLQARAGHPQFGQEDVIRQVLESQAPEQGQGGQQAAGLAGGEAGRPGQVGGEAEAQLGQPVGLGWGRRIFSTLRFQTL